MKVKGLLDTNKCTLFIISQLRDAIGSMGEPTTTTGGKAIKFYADVRWKVWKMNDKINELNKTTVDVIKNKLASPFGQAKFAIQWGYGDDYIPMKARFKVTDIREEGDKAVIDVTIDDAGLRERKPTNGQLTNKMVPSNGGYLRGEVAGVTKEKVEKMVKNYILLNFKDYVGKFPNYTSAGGYDIESTPERHAIKFNFIHSKV